MLIQTQAQRIIAKFGGPYRLAKLIGCQPSTVYRWTYDRPRGTGGLIPADSMTDVLRAAAYLKLRLTAKDLDPRPQEVKA